MFGGAQVQYRNRGEEDFDPAPEPARHATLHKLPARPDRRQHAQSLALVASLAGDMPLRMASEQPNDIASTGSASMRLRRFVRFYPAFSGAALFKPDGRLICTSDFRGGGARLDGAPFGACVSAQMRADVVNDPALAEAIAPLGGDVLLYADVECPRGRSTCGIVIARLR